MILHNPLYLILFIPLLPLVIYLTKKGQQRLAAHMQIRSGAVCYSDTAMLLQIRPTWKVRGAALMPWLTVSALLLVVLALARPQLALKESLVRREGVDILMALDVSSSMLEEDFRYEGKQTSRLEVVKAVTRDFIAKRPNDRIGIVVFSGRPYFLAPLTWDHDWCLSRLQEVRAGMIEEGTAIGSAIASAITRLRESKAKSKVIILLTDGINNAGQTLPEAAATVAKKLGIVVYTIGAGSKGVITSENMTNSKTPIDLDEDLLRMIATRTNGRYFRATDGQSLEAIFGRINKMERSALSTPLYQNYQELYPYILLLALLLLLIETILANTLFRRIP